MKADSLRIPGAKFSDSIYRIDSGVCRMGTAVRITRADRTAAELRAAAGKCRDGAQVRRMLALAMVLEGRPRTEAAQQNGMDRQTLRDWVHRYNAAGIDGLKSLQSPGPHRR